MSQATASSRPPPSAYPLTAAMVATGMSSSSAVRTWPSSLNSRAVHGVIGASSARSAPATKAGSADPVRMNARQESTLSRTACVSSRRVALFNALSDLGRFTVMVAIGPSRSTRMFSYAILSRRPSVGVEAALRLAPEPACVDVLPQERRGPVLVVAQPLLQHLGDGEAGVEPDEVRQRERPHGHVGPELHRGVDVLGGGEAFLQGEARLVEHRNEDAVDDEPGHVLREDGRLAHLLGQRASGRVGLVAGLRAADDFH